MWFMYNIFFLFSESLGYRYIPEKGCIYDLPPVTTLGMGDSSELPWLAIFHTYYNLLLRELSPIWLHWERILEAWSKLLPDFSSFCFAYCTLYLYIVKALNPTICSALWVLLVNHQTSKWAWDTSLHIVYMILMHFSLFFSSNYKFQQGKLSVFSLMYPKCQKIPST